MENKILPLGVLLSSLLVIALALVLTMPAPVSDSVPNTVPTMRYGIGNYCLECHTTTPTRALDVLRPVEWARDIPCDTLRKAYEGVWQTDTLVAAFQNAQNDVHAVGIDTSAPARRLNAQRVIAERFTRDESISLATITNRYQAARFQMNKAYAAMNEARAERDRAFIVIAVALATLFVLSGIIIGWRHTTRGKGRAATLRAAWVLTAASMLIVFVLFASPLFAFAPPLPLPTEEETARQAAVDQATRVSDAVARASVQAWMLGHLGAQWHALDKTQANAAYADALTVAHDKRASLAAHWGQLQALRESAVTWNAATQDLAVFRADKIETAALQAWHYRAIASEWLAVDRARATEALQLALNTISNSQSPISNLHDLELRAIAVTYAKLDPARANELMARVNDPFLRAWGWREMKQFEKAIESANQIQSSYERAWALREIARELPSAQATGLLFEAARLALNIEDKEAQAYALADIAIVWADKITGSDVVKAMQVIDGISPAYPQARVLALHGAGKATTDAQRAKEFFTRALAEAQKIGDAYKTAKFTAAIAADLARVDAAGALDVASKLNDVVLRDQAYRDIAIATNSPDVAAKISSAAFRVQALTVLGAQARDKTQAARYFQDAFVLADKVEDVAVLRDLAIAWAALDARAALAVVDKLEDAADKVAALRVIAVELARTDKSQSAEVFDRAVNLAKAVRVRGEPFAAARALAALASSYATIDATRANQAFTAALESVKRVNVKY